MIDFRSYTQPYLSNYHPQFGDICLLCQEHRFRDASLLLLECLKEHLNGEYAQNLLYLQYRTEVYLKESFRTQGVDVWVSSDYIHSIEECIRTGGNPLYFLTDKTSPLREVSRSL